jgi:hypothetical protein
MKDKPYFSQDGVSISKSEVLIDNEKLPIESLSSLSYRVIEPNKLIAGSIILIGALFLFDGALLVIVGGFAVLLGGIAWNNAKVRYALTINMTFGDKKTLISEDSYFIEQVILALNKVMTSTSSQFRN